MKPFTMKAVLKYRKQLEDSAALKLAEAQEKMKIAKGQYDSTRTEYFTLLDEREQKQRSGISIELLIQYEHRLAWINEKLKEYAEKVQSAQHDVEGKRKTVLLKSRDRRAIERLKEKQDIAWKKHLDKRENNQLDEISVLSYEGKKQRI